MAVLPLRSCFLPFKSDAPADPPREFAQVPGEAAWVLACTFPMGVGHFAAGDKFPELLKDLAFVLA